MRIGTILRVARDSDDLGLDAGMRAHVVRRKGPTVDLYVPSLDMLLADVDSDHPDLERAS